MTSKLASAGFYTLDSATIRPLFPDSNRSRRTNEPDNIDVTKTVIGLAMSESVDSPFVSGHIILSESNNLLEDVPLRGEEILTLTITDFYNKTVTYNFYIYAIDNIKVGSSINDRMVKYTLRFTTNQKLISDTKEIRKSFGNTKISDMAKTIYDEYFTTGDNKIDKELEVEETDGEQTLVIPNLRADAAMQFLSRRAYASNNKSSLYRFFETREKYYFCTHEYLINKYGGFEGKSEQEINQLFFIYNTVDDNTGLGQIIAQQSINDVQYGDKVDSMADIKQGAYRRTVTELDINYRTRISRQYDYSSEYKDYKAPDPLKLTHSTEFVNAYMGPDEAPETVLVTDFPQIGQNEGTQNMLKPYQHFYENYTTKPVVDYHMNKNSFQIEVNGRHELYPGMIINVELYKFSNTLAGTKEVDRERSGKYIVLGMTSKFDADIFKQTLAITKGGLAA